MNTTTILLFDFVFGCIIGYVSGWLFFYFHKKYYSTQLIRSVYNLSLVRDNLMSMSRFTEKDIDWLISNGYIEKVYDYRKVLSGHRKIIEGAGFKLTNIYSITEKCKKEVQKNQ